MSWPEPLGTAQLARATEDLVSSFFPKRQLHEAFRCGSSEESVALDESQPLEPKDPSVSCVSQTGPASVGFQPLGPPAPPSGSPLGSQSCCSLKGSLKVPPERSHPVRPSASSQESLLIFSSAKRCRT